MCKTDQHLIEKIRQGDKTAFEQLFFEYFYDLRSFALQITESNELAEDIVQEIFYKLWKCRQDWTISSSLKGYLFKAVRNEALNQLSKKKHQRAKIENFKQESAYYNDVIDNSLSRDDKKLVKKIWDVVAGLSERRQSVFALHRKHGLSYQEIAYILGITRKTVENHMGMALTEIREKLACEYNK